MLSGVILLGPLVFLIWYATRGWPSSSQVREPRVDICDDDQVSILTAELPGVDEEEILVNVEEGFIVSLETTGERKYATTIPLSESVIAATLQKTLRNGVLELRLQKA
ncbi:MAG: Hsp20/alpha crystallin family protein [Chloroflexi bacterium]|nr:Hsp20/alpha crystallin family protein [Chloroflexota bacterium]